MNCKITILLLLIPLAIPAMGQNLKTYSGSYDGGKATYTYIENEDGSRIYQGDFSWEKSIKYRDLTAKGTFKDGKRDGLWVFTSKTTSNTSFPASETLRVMYKDGNHEGEYSYKASPNYSGKGSGNYIMTEYTRAPQGMTVEATCKDNLYDGKLTLGTLSDSKYEVEYQASSSAYRVGIWKFITPGGVYYYNRETGEKYLISSETGEKIKGYDSCWDTYTSSIKVRCIELEAFCEPYPSTSGRYVPIQKY